MTRKELEHDEEFEHHDQLFEYRDQYWSQNC
jgi:hypothetical protein